MGGGVPRAGGLAKSSCQTRSSGTWRMGSQGRPCNPPPIFSLTGAPRTHGTPRTGCKWVSVHILRGQPLGTPGGGNPWQQQGDVRWPLEGHVTATGDMAGPGEHGHGGT